MSEAGERTNVKVSTERPVDNTPVHTEDLPPLPTRDRTIPATAWVEAPDELRRFGEPIGHQLVGYKRRIGTWLLWRAGPPSKDDAIYMAVRADDLSVRHTFRLLPDGSGEGTGPSGRHHTRFRTWKEDLRDSP